MQLLEYLLSFLVTLLYSFYCSERIELCNCLTGLNNVNSFLINNVNCCFLIISVFARLQGSFLPIQESLSFKATVRERLNKVNTLSIPNLVVNHLDCPKNVHLYGIFFKKSTKIFLSYLTT